MEIAICDPVIAPTCNIRFDGPFVLAFTQDYSDATDANEIVAFVPRDPMRERMPRHYLFVERKLVGCDDGSQQYDFSMVTNDQGYCGIKVNACPTKVDPRFNDFRVQQPCKCQDYFVKISIPRPKSIWLSEKPVNVRFEDGSDGLMPLNHICEYEVDPSNTGIAIASKEINKSFCLASDSPFLFQVGISQFGNMSEQHALHFYNDVISTCFPTASWRKLKVINPRHPRSLDVDCKLGGMIGGG
ncbi:MAG TPA: hypothetical protein VFP59_15575 [Candidatus Angelobacter sp.]|nr:hypothetical protein [Candidatus Angelobacter sp.]